jgi:hypothetical protein
MTDHRAPNRTYSVRTRPPIAVVAVVVGASGFFACKESPPKLTEKTPVEPSAYVASASASMTNPPAPATSASDAFPLTADQIRQIVNPKDAPAYDGPTGVVEGTVHVTGDKPLVRTLAGVPKGCENAQAIHGPTYRAGPKGELADALVGVIGYSGYLAPSHDDKVVTIRDCALEPTVIDLSLGQRLMIGNVDTQMYMPQTAAKQYVGRLAMKDQSPVPVFFTAPGAYAMSWILGDPPAGGYPIATVFVIPNALHMVTGLDGSFRIAGIPVGKARVTASHLDMPESQTEVEIKAGEVTKVDLTMTFKAVVKPAASEKPNPIK